MVAWRWVSLLSLTDLTLPDGCAAFERFIGVAQDHFMLSGREEDCRHSPLSRGEGLSCVARAQTCRAGPFLQRGMMALWSFRGRHTPAMHPRHTTGVAAPQRLRLPVAGLVEHPYPHDETRQRLQEHLGLRDDTMARTHGISVERLARYGHLHPAHPQCAPSDAEHLACAPARRAGPALRDARSRPLPGHTRSFQPPETALREIS